MKVVNMNDKARERQKLISEMLDMQHKFIDYDRKQGLDPEDYFVSKDGHPLHQYKERYSELATKLVDLAHELKGSQR